MTDKKVSDAAWTLLTSFQEANRIVAEHLMTAQEHNRKLAEEFFTEGMEVLRANQQAAHSLVVAQERTMQYAERFFTSGIEVLESQAHGIRALLADLEQQVNRQLEALQTLSRAPVEMALDVFSAPLAAYQNALDVAAAVTQESFKQAQQATGQVSQASKQSDKHQVE
jgi:hypothetical protein